ncbi:MAG: hypothetical protein AABY26_01500, partial [Nanoarchaeota archaeon]
MTETTLTPWKDYAHVPPGESPKSKGLVKLLEKLQKEDTWFEYNVPAHLRTAYTEDQLLNYLDTTYSASGFRIDDPKEVGKYAKSMERVILKRTLEETCWKIPPKAEGRITQVEEGKDPVVLFKVDWKHQNPKVVVPREKLWVWGEKHLFGGEENLESGGSNGITIHLKKDYLVTYTGKEIVKNNIYIPAGAEGIMQQYVERNSSGWIQINELRVLFAYRPEILVPDQNKPVNIDLKDVSLVRPNFIDYHKLRQESFTISDF